MQEILTTFHRKKDPFHKKHRKLLATICELIEDYSLVGFAVLNICVSFLIARHGAIAPIGRKGYYPQLVEEKEMMVMNMMNMKEGDNEPYNLVNCV